MQKSKYNIFVQKKNVTLCYNSFNNSFIVIPVNGYNAFNKSIENFKEIYPNHYDSFKENGFIIPDDMDELNTLRFLNKQEAFSSRKHFFMVYPTQDCNLKCWYCYETHVAKSFMNSDIQERIIKHVQLKLKKNEFDSFNLTFFGGEPLMNFNKVAFPLALSTKKTIEDHGKEFNCFFITNGTLITKSMISKFKKINPGFQITLDGDKNKHDKVRIRKKDNGATYEKIINSIHEITEHLEPKRKGERLVTIRINFDNKTLRNIENIIADLKNVDREKVFIHFERVWQTKGNVDNEQKELLLEAIKFCQSQGFLAGHGIFGKRLTSCPAELNHYAIINYDGLVYRCNGRNLTKENSEGYLSETGEIKWDENKKVARLGRATFENPMCLPCKLLPSCMGPCSQKNIENNWTDLENVCSLKVLDISLNDYLEFEFKTQYLKNSCFADSK